MMRTDPFAVLKRVRALQGAWAWALYLPLGAKYGLAAGLVAACAWRSWRRPGSIHRPFQADTLCICALLTWLLVSAAWSPAAPTEWLSAAWHYALLLCVPLIAAQVPPAVALAALWHFAAASAAVGAMFLASSFGLSLPWPVGMGTVHSSGNQRIATSVLLAAGAALCVVWLSAPGRPVARATALALAALAVAGLVSQDRRSGMLVLPAVLALWVLAKPGPLLRRACLLGVLALTAFATWQISDGVRARFAEGMGELSLRAPDDRVDTSWGQRRRMAEITASMVRQRPLAGWGLGSWEHQWALRTPPGSVLAANSTPHNEFLHLAQQAGVPAVLLFATLIGLQLQRARRAGPAGAPLLVVWGTIAVAASFNAVLRDAKFALALLVLAGLAGAAARIPARPR